MNEFKHIQVLGLVTPTHNGLALTAKGCAVREGMECLERIEDAKKCSEACGVSPDPIILNLLDVLSPDQIRKKVRQGKDPMEEAKDGILAIFNQVRRNHSPEELKSFCDWVNIHMQEICEPVNKRECAGNQPQLPEPHDGTYKKYNKGIDDAFETLKEVWGPFLPYFHKNPNEVKLVITQKELGERDADLLQDIRHQTRKIERQQTREKGRSVKMKDIIPRYTLRVDEELNAVPSEKLREYRRILSTRERRRMSQEFTPASS